MSVLGRLAAERLELRELRAVPADRWPRQLPATAPTGRERMAAGTQMLPEAKAAAVARNEPSICRHENWVSVPLLSFLHCMTLSESVNIPGLQCPHL